MVGTITKTTVQTFGSKVIGEAFYEVDGTPCGSLVVKKTSEGTKWDAVPEWAHIVNIDVYHDLIDRVSREVE